MKLELILILSSILVFLYLLLVVSAGAFGRIRRERRELRLAIEGRAVEIPRFLLLGLVPALAVSTTVSLLGFVLPLPIVIALIGVTVIGLTVPGFYSPLIYGLAGGIGWLLNQFWPNLFTPLGQDVTLGFFILLACVMLFALVADLCAPYHSAPHIVRSHGRRRLQNRVRQLIFFPLVVPVPGTLLTAWPLMKLLSPEIHGVSFAVLPLVLGFGLRSFGSVRSKLHRRALLDGALLLAAVVVALLCSAAVITSTTGLLVLAAIAIVGLAALLLTPQQEQNALTDAPGGVRVITVIPETPAAKMGLHAGDTILQCNGQDVPSPRAFYTATQHLGTFCRLRVRDQAGQFRLAETAIFTGAPHMLGVITFPEED